MIRPASFPFAITVTLLGATILAAAMTDRQIPENLAIPLDRIGSEIAGWKQINQQSVDDETLRTLKPTSYISRTYQKGALQIDLFIAYYAQQHAGETMHSPNHCLPGAGWEIMQRDSVTIAALGREIPINKYVIENLGTQQLMFYWYQSRSRIVANEYWAKLLLARDTVLTAHTGGSIVRVVLPDDPKTAAEGVAFASALIPKMQRCLGDELH